MIRSVTEYSFWGVEPPEWELAGAEWAYQQLAADKERVTAWIIASLVQMKPRTPFMEDNYDPTTGYGIILWRFGAEYVLKLEPEVLRAAEVHVRYSGIYILRNRGGEQCDNPELTAVALAVLQRERDPLLISEMIITLAKFSDPSIPAEVMPFLLAKDSIVRKSAVQYFWLYPNEEALPKLVAMLTTEVDEGVGFWLSWTLCRQAYTERIALLTAENVGIRAGVLCYLDAETRGAYDNELPTIIARIATERDTVCQYEMGCLLTKKGDQRGLPLLNMVMASTARVIHPYHRSDIQTLASSILNQLLPQAGLGLTDEDRTIAQQNHTWIYAGVAARFNVWWHENQERLQWNAAERKFRIAP